MASVSESTSGSNSAADSYVGSLISLTSKSEIRYEGVLYNINTEESSIGLINVRSFGTEGRKNDGQQIPPSDKVYEYILFRGSDIKDLQVKSSPPVQPTPSINNDPAIIQSHYPRPATTSSNLPSSVSGSLTDVNSHSVQLGLPGSNFQGPLPLYQPGGSIGSWGGPPPAPSANGSGLAMPLYWQGYYGAPNGLPNLHQQTLLRPPLGLSMPSSMQQQMQYPNFNPLLPTGLSNLPEFPSGLTSVSSSSPSVVSISFPSTNLPSTLPPAPSVSLSSETFPSSVPNKVPTISLPAATLPGNLPSLSPLATSSPDINSAVPPISNKPNAISVSSFSYQTVSQPAPVVVGSSNAIHTGAPAPPLVTPGQLLQSGSSIGYSSQPLQTSHKDVEVVTLSTSLPEQSVLVSSEAQSPILPLSGVSRVSHRPNGAPVQTGHGDGYRGRGRGRGAVSSHPVTEFTEDFDFTAMNEKFKKDEVWGHLGKSSKYHLKEKYGDENGEYDDQYEEDGEGLKFEIKPVYNKDDFFDSLSSHALDHDSHNSRTRYSVQIKIDTETFGDFVRYRGGRGGRGRMRGGRSRGSYHGRGYCYSGRGRGRGMSSRASYD